jgi:hypothetical protein
MSIKRQGANSTISPPCFSQMICVHKFNEDVLYATVYFLLCYFFTVFEFAAGVLWTDAALCVCVGRRTPGALPKVLLSVRSWEPDCLVDLYGLLDTWPKPDIIGAHLHVPYRVPKRMDRIEGT